MLMESYIDTTRQRNLVSPNQKVAPSTLKDTKEAASLIGNNGNWSIGRTIYIEYVVVHAIRPTYAPIPTTLKENPKEN